MMYTANQMAYLSNYNEVFLQVLVEKGFDLQAWLSSARLDIELISRFNGFMRYQDMERFFNQNQDMLDIDGVGLAVGEKLNVTAHGEIALAILSSPTCREGIETFRRYLKIQTQFIHFDLLYQENEFAFEFNLTEKMTPVIQRFYMECALSGTFTFLKHYTNQDDMPVKLMFSHPEPAYADLYYELFGDQVKFNCRCNRIYADPALLERTPPTKNESVYAMARQQCELKLQALSPDSDIVEKIHRIFLNSPWRFPSQAQVADQLSVSIRTLRRKLQSLNISYQDIADSARESLAKKYLLETDWPVAEIGDLLGYSEVSNFKRAFKRWCAETPNQYRNNYQYPSTA